MTNLHHRLVAAILLTLWSGRAMAAIDFSKPEGLVTDLAASLGGTFATAFLLIGLAALGFLAAFNRISWMWVGLMLVGAFLVFGGPAIVSNLRSTLG
ncbi:MAG: TrbC/VirB2 family protein [Albidovulum sp.]|uniref:TrbC/VirB2 family protein n=1 Tax=Albidovulum sp. TaxID=1872424 RepID=UPI003CB66DC9